MVLISRLDVANFRGIPQSTASLIFGEKSVLLFGENGTGKSSFVDAIEKLLCGRVDSLDGRAQGISSDRHGPHIRAGASGPSISLTFSNPDFKYVLAADSAKVPQALMPYLDAARQDLFNLRRRDILRFIESEPRNRYAYLRPFLPLAGIEEVENALRQAKDQAAEDMQLTRAEFMQHEGFITKTLGLSGEPTELRVLDAISKQMKEVGLPDVTSFRELDDRVSLLDQELAKFGDTAIVGKLHGAISAFQDLLQAASDETLTGLITACRRLGEKEASEARIFYDRVLEDGIRWITEEKRTACPLCEQPIDAAAILANAQKRLDAMRELVALRKQASSSFSKAIVSIRAIKESADRTLRSLAALQDRDIKAAGVEAISNTLAALERELGKGLGSLDLVAVQRATLPLRENSDEKSSVANTVRELQGKLDKVPSPDRAKQLLSARQKIINARESWNQIGSAKLSLKTATTEAEQAETVYQRALEARQEVVQELYDELSKEIDGLYDRLHPGEGHGDIRLEVRDVGQGSANLHGSFYERKDEDPRGYYSDAHLDTLGISIFLALRRWHRKLYPEFNLLVLDDVLTSVDNAHAVRLTEMLLREFPDYQMLLTTHDRIWFEHFRDIQARCGLTANFVNKVIHKWTIDEGPDLREPEDERERLRTLLIGASSVEIAAMAGRLLEHMLQEMRYSMSLSVHAKPSERYEIGDLWPAFYKTAKKYVSFYAQAGRCLDSLDVSWPIRNWVGAHFNDWAKGVSRTSAVQFGEAVTGLFDLVFCAECRRFIMPSVAPIGQLSCRCGALTYPAPGREKVVVLDRVKLAKQSDGVLRDARFDTTLYFEQKRADRAREH